MKPQSLPALWSEFLLCTSVVISLVPLTWKSCILRYWLKKELTVIINSNFVCTKLLWKIFPNKYFYICLVLLSEDYFARKFNFKLSSVWPLFWVLFLINCVMMASLSGTQTLWSIFYRAHVSRRYQLNKSLEPTRIYWSYSSVYFISSPADSY